MNFEILTFILLIITDISSINASSVIPHMQALLYNYLTSKRRLTND